LEEDYLLAKVNWHFPEKESCGGGAEVNETFAVTFRA
jgi:hypothetical protein